MKLAIIGTGMIISDALLAASKAEEIELVAIFGRPHSKDKAEKFAEEYGIPEVYTDYEELLTKSSADTVYVGLVNSVHYEYAKKALEAGKHVILEKPFVIKPEEAEELVSLAKEKKLFCLEAITPIHNVIFDTMKEHLPKIGQPKLVMANFSQYSSRYDNYLKEIVAPAFDPACNGGALYDLNVYCLHFIIGLLGRPQSVQYYPNRGFNGVDTSGMLVMDYGDFKAVSTAAKDSDSHSFVSIQGDKGHLYMDGKPNAAAHLTVATVHKDDVINVPSAEMNRFKNIVVTSQTDNEVKYEDKSGQHRMEKEFRDFADIIDNHKAEIASELMEESIEVVKVLYQASQS